MDKYRFLIALRLLANVTRKPAGHNALLHFRHYIISI